MDDTLEVPLVVDVPLEVLERRLTGRAAELAAAEAEWMGWLGEYDRRRGWAEWGCVGAAQWLSWKCGMSPSAARERVRVAGALDGLPAIVAAFGEGRLSYSKVQSLTRIANPHNEQDLIVMALNASGAQLAKICAGYRDSAAASDEAAAQAFVDRAVTTRRNHDGTTTIKLRVPDDVAGRIADHVEKVVAAMIDDALADLDLENRRAAIAHRGGIAALRADAFAELLTGEASRAEPTPADVALIIDEHAAAHGCADTCAQAREPVTVEQSTNEMAASVRSDAADTCAQAREPVTVEHPAPGMVAGAERLDAADTCAQVRETEAFEPPAKGMVASAERTDAADTCAQVREPVTVETEERTVSGAEAPHATPTTSQINGCNRCQTPLPDAAGYEILVNDRVVAPSTGHRLLCDPRLHAIIESADAGPLAVGRGTRVISRRMRRALNRRDNGCCQFPGCTATRRLHAHHIIHWLHGGLTEIDNLILVCQFHHHLVHEGGWSIDSATRQFVRPDGDAVEPTPEHLRAGANTIEPLTWRGAAGPLEPIDYGPFDLPWTTAILHHNEAINRRNASATQPL